MRISAQKLIASLLAVTLVCGMSPSYSFASQARESSAQSVLEAAQLENAAQAEGATQLEAAAQSVEATQSEGAGLSLSARIAAFVAAGDAFASETVASGLSSASAVDAYMAGLSADESRYVVVEAGVGASSGPCYNITIYATPQWEVAQSDGTSSLSAGASALASSREASGEDLYGYLQDAWESMTATINLSKFYISTNDLYDVYLGAVTDAPEQFNVRTWWSMFWDHSTGYVTQVRPRYLTTDAAQYTAMRTAYEAQVSQALSTVPDGVSDLAKLYYLHNWICANVDYNYDATDLSEDTKYPDAFTAYGAMVTKSAVCQGYSMALSDLLNRAGVYNKTLLTFANANPHAWNMVRISNKWYHVDSTWDAAGGVGPADYSYFMKSDAAIEDGAEHTNWRGADNYGWDSSMVASDTSYDNYEWASYNAAADKKKDDTPSTHEHVWTLATEVSATCTTEGSKVYRCTCGDGYVETVAALGHSWGEWVVTKEASTEAAGEKTRTCERCGVTEAQEIPKTDPSDPADEGPSIRLSGMEADATSAAISAATYEQSDWVFLARMDDFADAMSATGLAGLFEAPIILTDRYSLSDSAAAEITRLGAKNVYIIGGWGAMPGDFESELAALGVTNVGRIYGTEYYDTSVKCAEQIAKYGGSEDLERAIIAYGQNFQDALSISSFAYKYHVPILLETAGATSTDRALPAEAVQLLSTGAFANASIYVPGGNGAVSYDSVERVFGDKLRGGYRIYGEDGYDTSNALATHFIETGELSASTVCVATGAEAAKGVDALAGAALAGKAGGVMLLASAQPAMEADNYTTIDDGFDSQGNPSFLKSNASSVTNCYILGGSYVLPDAFKAKVDTLLA